MWRTRWEKKSVIVWRVRNRPLFSSRCDHSEHSSFVHNHGLELLSKLDTSADTRAYKQKRSHVAHKGRKQFDRCCKVRNGDSWVVEHRLVIGSSQERQENFLLQGLLCVLTLNSVSIPSLCYCSRTKRSRSFCQKCRWQVTVKHTCTLLMWLRINWHCQLCMLAWCTQNTRRDGSSFKWHQPCNN